MGGGAGGEVGGAGLNAGAGEEGGVPGVLVGSAGTVKFVTHIGHFMSCPAYCSGTVSIF